MAGMSTETKTANDSTAIWERFVQFADPLPPAAARELLKVRFSDRDLHRMRELTAKAQAGGLTPREETEIDTFERLGCLLDILHSEPRRVLAKGRAGS
jgi:hypothetical protein